MPINKFPLVDFGFLIAVGAGLDGFKWLSYVSLFELVSVYFEPFEQLLRFN
jgi:hypothetical protein